MNKVFSAFFFFFQSRLFILTTVHAMYDVNQGLDITLPTRHLDLSCWSPKHSTHVLRLTALWKILSHWTSSMPLFSYRIN